MGFSVSVIADILKFPWPLFPKYKHVYPLGVRFQIPENHDVPQTHEFVITLPGDNKYELQGLVFASTGYKDGDKFSVFKNNEVIMKDIYTKELGQDKDIRPIVKIDPSTDVLKFVYNNVTGTSKVIYIDFDMTASKSVLNQ